MTGRADPGAARRAAAKVYDRRFAAWAVVDVDVECGVDAGVVPESGGEPASEWLIDRPLHPPSERAALADTTGTASWIAAWREADPGSDADAHGRADGHVVWASRRWASLGTQTVPDRLRLGTPGAVARFAGRSRHWKRAVACASALLGLLRAAADKDAPNRDAARDAVRRVLGMVVDLDPADTERLVGVLGWVLEHETAGLFVRQVPVRGVDTKWLERHRRIVDPLYAAATGRAGLDLAQRPVQLRVRFLDPALAPSGLRDVTAPVAELAGLAVAPRVVVVVENLESLLALPDRAGVVAVHGQGYAARHLHRTGWVAAADIVYWGDIDTDGLNILSAVRSHLPQARSILMDRTTLTEHLDLAVPEPRPRRAVPEHLTDIEADAFAALAELGDVRLEQERIPWGTAVAALDAALRSKDAGSHPIM